MKECDICGKYINVFVEFIGGILCEPCAQQFRYRLYHLLIPEGDEFFACYYGYDLDKKCYVRVKK